jgi:hypothetical protein
MAREGVSSAVYSAMQTKTPYKSYKKVILGKVYVTVWNEFEDVPEGLIIKGNPRGKEQDECIIDIWSEKGDMFFKRANRRLLSRGEIVDFKRKITVPVITGSPYAQATDEELIDLLNQKYQRIASLLNTIEDVAPLYRLKTLAEELDKTQKVNELVQSRLSEIQEREYTAVQQEK